MTPASSEPFEIFLVTLPGLEKYLYQEVQAAGFDRARAIGGGVTILGGWDDVWRANLILRGASKVLARIGEFRALHLAQLDKRSRKFPWGDFLTPGHKIKVEVSTNRKSKIYHAGAAIERIERAITEEFGSPIATSMNDADILIKVRIDQNLVIFSIDTSGTALHKRGHKQAMGKAPLRETIAAMALRANGYDGNEPVLDPMCGSGTFIIEAAEIAANMMAGRARDFTFEKLASYDPAAVQAMKDTWQTRDTTQRFYGSDRNDGAILAATKNAKRAGVSELCEFSAISLSDIVRPDGPPGLVVVNPPYGKRIGDKRQLFALYNSFGDVMRERFAGWRVSMITTDRPLAESTKLPWRPLGAPIAHGGLKAKLFMTGPL